MRRCMYCIGAMAVAPLHRHEPFASRVRMRLEEHCADSLGHRIYPGIGGRMHLILGATRSKDGSEQMVSRDASSTPDRSNGWEVVAHHFFDSSIGVATVNSWASLLPAGSAVLDLGCGPGSLRSAVLNRAEFAVHAVDAAPSMVLAYQQRFPAARVACEAVEDTRFFGRLFDGALAWGLLFLLSPDTQRMTIPRIAAALRPGARFLFTAPAQLCTWADLSTGRPSHSLGAGEYGAVLADSHLSLVAQYEDEGQNHYYDAVKE